MGGGGLLGKGDSRFQDGGDGGVGGDGDGGGDTGVGDGGGGDNPLSSAKIAEYVARTPPIRSPEGPMCPSAHSPG